MMESMNIHPTSGGVAPLYKPANPSFLTVWTRHCRGPENRARSEVWRRTLIVSNGWPTLGKRKRMSAQDLSRENRSKLKEGRDVYKKEERPINHSTEY